MRDFGRNVKPGNAQSYSASKWPMTCSISL
jgi:hypothetical protein